MKLDADRAYAELIRAGEEWADLDSAASLLEESRKSVLAELMNQCVAPSIAAKEMIALADPAYRLHLSNMVKARRDATVAKVRYDAIKVLAELRRSEESTRRAELQMR